MLSNYYKRIMKKPFKILLLFAFISSFSSCNNDEAEISTAPEMFSILMAVTNSEGEDLVFSSEDYLTTGDYAGRYKFESWNAYLGDKLVQSDVEDIMSHFKPTAYNPKMNQHLIVLETNGALQEQMKDWSQRHRAKYVMASPELFGNTKEHTIDLNILGIEDEVKKTFFIEFSISVDGVEQTVYYPEYWEGLYPKDPHGNAHSPYFVLNVDAL